MISSRKKSAFIENDVAEDVELEDLELDATRAKPKKHRTSDSSARHKKLD